MSRYGNLSKSGRQARLARPQQLLSAAERCWGEIRSALAARAMAIQIPSYS